MVAFHRRVCISRAHRHKVLPPAPWAIIVMMMVNMKIMLVIVILMRRYITDEAVCGDLFFSCYDEDE